jgi:hypothetical protein
MIVVVDASVLVAELLRRRGRELLSHPDLSAVVAEVHHAARDGDRLPDVVQFVKDRVYGSTVGVDRRLLRVAQSPGR